MRFIYNFTLFKLCLTQHIKKKKKRKNVKVTKKGKIFNLLGKDFVFFSGNSKNQLANMEQKTGCYFLAHLILLFKRTNCTNLCYNSRI